MRRRSPVVTLSAWVVTAALVLPVTAGAAQPQGMAPTPLQEARDLYKEGRAAFDTADYDGAVQLWTKAYAKLPDGESSAAIRNDIVYNISTAQIQAHKLDGDPSRLKRAEVLLRQYMDNHISATEDIEGMVAETEKVRRRLAEVQQKIAEAQGDSDASSQAPEPGPSGRATPPTSSPAPVDRPGLNGLQIGGIVTLSAVALTAGATIAGAVITANAKDDFEQPETREQGRKNHRTGSAVAIVGGALTGALIVTGAVLLVLGKKRRTRTAFVPRFTPGGVILEF